MRRLAVCLLLYTLNKELVYPKICLYFIVHSKHHSSRGLAYGQCATPCFRDREDVQPASFTCSTKKCRHNATIRLYASLTSSHNLVHRWIFCIFFRFVLVICEYYFTQRQRLIVFFMTASRISMLMPSWDSMHTEHEPQVSI